MPCKHYQCRCKGFHPLGSIQLPFDMIIVHFQVHSFPYSNHQDQNKEWSKFNRILLNLCRIKLPKGIVSADSMRCQGHYRENYSWDCSK